MDVNVSSFPIDYLRVQIIVAGYVAKTAKKENVHEEKVIYMIKKWIETSNTLQQIQSTVLQRPIQTSYSCAPIVFEKKSNISSEEASKSAGADPGYGTVLNKLDGENSQADSGYLDENDQTQASPKSIDQLLELMCREYHFNDEDLFIDSSSLSIETHREKNYLNIKPSYLQKYDVFPTKTSQDNLVDDVIVDKVTRQSNDLEWKLNEQHQYCESINAKQFKLTDELALKNTDNLAAISICRNIIKSKADLAIEFIDQASEFISKGYHARKDHKQNVQKTIEAALDAIANYLVDSNLSTRKRSNQNRFDKAALKFACVVDKLFTDCINGQCMIGMKSLCESFRKSFRHIFAVWIRKYKRIVLDENLVFNRTIRFVRSFIEQLQCIFLLTLLTNIVYDVSASYTRLALGRLSDPKTTHTSETYQEIARVNSLLHGVSDSCNEQLRRSSGASMIHEIGHTNTLHYDDDLADLQKPSLKKFTTVLVTKKQEKNKKKKRIQTKSKQEQNKCMKKQNKNSKQNTREALRRSARYKE